MLFGVLLALASALATNVGFLLRHRGARAAPDVDVRHPIRSAIGLFASKWWSIGYAVAAVAYVLHVGAMSLAPLSIVQGVLAGGLVMLAVVADRFFGFHLGRREWIGVTLTAVALALLALTGKPGPGDSADYSATAMFAFICALVGAGVILIVSCRSDNVEKTRRGLLLGIAAGLLFTVTHVAVKGLTGRELADVVLNPALLLVVGCAVAAFFASARSLQLGDAVPVIALTSVASNASAIPAGIVVFGDPLGHDALTVVVRTIAFLTVVAAAALIPAPTRAADEMAERAAEETGDYGRAPAVA